MRPSESKSTATKLLKVEKFSKKLIDCLVESVNPTSGLIYAQKADTARVYLTALDGSGKQGYSTVNKNNSLYVIISAALFEGGEKCFLKVECQPTAV